MAITKIQSESLNLADTYAFTGTVTGAGGVNTPAFAARINGEQTISHNTSTKLTLNTEIFDTANAYDTSTYRFTPQTAGKYSPYFFYTCINGGNSADSTTDYINVYFYKNGSSQGRLHPRGYNNAQMLYATTYTKSFDLSAGDYIEVYVMVDTTSGSPKITSGGDIISNFGGYRVKS
jgi:hypothetical protein